MKTVQDYLKELDTDKLVEEYFFRDPIPYEEFAARTSHLTVQEIRAAYKRRMRLFIDKLREIDAVKSREGNSVLFAYRYLPEYRGEDIGFGCAVVDEVLKSGKNAEIYTYSMLPQNEIAGFFVADTELSKRYIYELIADVLYESSFFGFNQEGLEKLLAGFGSSMCELERVESGETNLPTIDRIMDNICECLGFVPDSETEDEKELRREVWKAQDAYCRHSRQKELNNVLNILLEEENK